MKKIYLTFLLILATGFLTENFAQDTPVNADIVVAQDGSGDFASIQEAIDAAPANSDRRTVIYIKRGLYDEEKLIVPGDKINITLIGESREETILSYHIYDCNGGKCPPEDAALWSGDNIRTSATLTVLGDGFKAENMTIQNTAGPVGQAQAVTIRADKCIFLNVDFYGYQDTLYFWSDGNRSYFENCLIAGRTDFIYGSGTVWFQECEIRTWGGGWITAPSTAMDQPYGFVFNECTITYATNSPRGGDDGELVRLGRPWHEYPKVAWLNSYMTEMIHPEGWGDTWNMEYAATSEDLHLYEYNNSGPGADTSQRANWAGIKELTDEEAQEYTIQKVMAGTDGWDPTAEAPLLQTYTWTGEGSTNSWLNAENWDPAAIPAKGESATVDSMTITADGDTFPADLYLNKAYLQLTANSVALYISASGAQINATGEISLSAKISTKGDLILSADNQFTFNGGLLGVHQLKAIGPGRIILNADNSNFSGDIIVETGELEASLDGSLGRGSIKVLESGTLIISHENAFYAESALEVNSGATLQLNSNIILTEFYIDGVMQPVGEYTAATNPDLISGDGKVVVGRPTVFVFHRGSNGNWDNPEHYVPALLPMAGDTALNDEEMETTSTIFEADIIVRSPGSIRLRGDESKNHTATGTIYMEEGTSFRYNTGGTGMYLNAPVKILGEVTMIMESDNSAGSTMTLAGPISGDGKVIALNNGKGSVNTGNLLLTGNNAGFTGTWDATQYSSKYPSTPGYITTIEGKNENAFGRGTINAALQNKIIFSHSKAAGDTLFLNLDGSAKVVLNANVAVKRYTLNGSPVPKGEYSAATNPEIYEGAGTLTVGESDVIPTPEELPAFPGAEGHGRYTTGGRGGQVIYVTNLEDNSEPGSLRYAIGQSGPRIILFKVSGTIQLQSRLNIKNGDVTIAGQTAPGDGITLRDYPVVVDADNVIIRFIRFRMGDKTAQEADAVGGREIKNAIIDHCSMSWSTDECVSFYQNENFTLQWCIIAESLRNSVHDKGSHGYGGIWGGKNASFHHNLLAHHDSRNPRLGEMRGDAFALTDLVDLRNNVIYNWKGNSAYGGEAMNVNIVNCYYKPGPATTKEERIISIDKLTDSGYPISDVWGKFYIDGNVLTASNRATDDNWAYGVYNQFNAKYTLTAEEKADMRLAEPLDPGVVTTHEAEMAYQKILEYGGASLVTDSVDMRIIHDLETGTATYMDGGNGSIRGIIDTQDAVGGWPVLQSEPAPQDSDNDGMPDTWETANDLDPNNPDDAQAITVDGVYPNIEVYINSLVEHIITEQNKDAISTSAGNIRNGKSEIQLFYNSISGELNIGHRNQVKEVKIYSMEGKMLIFKKINSISARLPLNHLNKGIYIVKAIDVAGNIFTKKVPVF